MKRITLVLLIATAAACSTAKHTQTANTPFGIQTTMVTSPIAGADGSSFEKAVVIQEKNEMTGVDAEYKWLGKQYPGYKLGKQSLVYHNNKPYDILAITTAEGAEKKVYFEVSNFYGKL